MTTSLRTSSAIKRALAEEYAYLVATFDPKHRERQATNAIKKRLAPWQCAACGRRPPEVERLEAAHIAPLAECAETTPQNLVLLCKEPRAKPPGCHTLFDSGCASIDEMDACRESWTAGRSSVLRDRMLLVFQQHGPRPHQQGHLTKELTNLRAQRNSLSVTSPQWHDVQLSIAEVTRRRARRDALSGALHEIEKVESRLLVDGRARSRFHYERAYINLLLGNLRQAFIDFDEGRTILAQSSTVGNRWRWAAHTALLAQVSCIMRAGDTAGGWSWNSVLRQLADGLGKARADLKELHDTDGIGESELRNSSRWVYNCLVHLVKPDLAQGRVNAARKRWDEAAKYWRTMDITSGWDAGSRSNLLALYGQIALASAASEEDARNALPYLVRALVLLLGLRRQQPEGVRDLLFGIADGLRRVGEGTRGGQIMAVAAACVDYSSWFHPSVPTADAA